jgi:hypothetical protein
MPADGDARRKPRIPLDPRPVDFIDRLFGVWPLWVVPLFLMMLFFALPILWISILFNGFGWMTGI